MLLPVRYSVLWYKLVRGAAFKIILLLTLDVSFFLDVFSWLSLRVLRTLEANFFQAGLKKSSLYVEFLQP